MFGLPSQHIRKKVSFVSAESCLLHFIFEVIDKNILVLFTHVIFFYMSFEFGTGSFLRIHSKPEVARKY